MQELKSLGKARSIVEQATQLKVTYAYDDLVFIEHNPFLLRFDVEKSDQMFLHFNVDCEDTEVEKLEKALTNVAKKEGMALTKAEPYELFAPKNKYEIEVRFQA